LFTVDFLRRKKFEIYQFTLFRIGLLTNKKEGEVHASVFVSTEFHELQVPFRSDLLTMYGTKSCVEVGGSVIYQPPGSGSIDLNHGIRILFNYRRF
jgi:hypothetical protein